MMLGASARLLGRRVSSASSGGLLARSLPKRQLGMSITAYGERTPRDEMLMLNSRAGWDFQNNCEIPDVPEFKNLEEWRAHLKAKGEHDPLEHLNAEERVAYVDSHRMLDGYQKVMGPEYRQGWEYGPWSKFYGRSKVLLTPQNYLANPWLCHKIDNSKWEIYYTKEFFWRFYDNPGYLKKNALPKAVIIIALLIIHHQYSLYERNFRRELKRKYLEKDKD